MVEPIAIVTGHDVLKAGQVLGEARNSAEMLAIWRTAKAKIGLSNKDFDELANFADGSGRQDSRSYRRKNFGPVTFTGFNWTLAIKWVAVVDAEQLQIVEQYWKDRQRQVSHVRVEPVRVSKKILERAKPILLKELGEKLALALGDDVDHLLLGMRPPDPPVSSVDSAKTDAAKRLEDDEKGIAPADTLGRPPPVATRSHLRVVQTKSGASSASSPPRFGALRRRHAAPGRRRARSARQTVVSTRD